MREEGQNGHGEKKRGRIVCVMGLVFYMCNIPPSVSNFAV
jgi:hypothetical protein